MRRTLIITEEGEAADVFLETPGCVISPVRRMRRQASPAAFLDARGRAWYAPCGDHAAAAEPVKDPAAEGRGTIFKREEQNRV